MSQHIGVLKITMEAIKSMMILPDDYTIVTANIDHDRNMLYLYVSGADIAETEEGAKLPELTPVYHAINSENGKQRIVELSKVLVHEV